MFDGEGEYAGFNACRGVAVDDNGNIFAADQGNYRIRKVTPGGRVITLAGCSSAGFADGLGPPASFYSPHGVAVDLDGNVIVADLGNHRIRKVTLDGRVTTLAGNGGSGFADGLGISA